MKVKTYYRKRGIKRGLALLMVLIIVLSMVPAAALAAAAPDDQNAKNQVVEPGDVLYYDASGGIAGEGNFVVSASKTIEQLENENEFEITLQVQTTVNVSELEVSPDAAVVLVIDISGSMSYCADCGAGKSSRGGGTDSPVGLTHTAACKYSTNSAVAYTTQDTRMKVAKEAAIEFLNSFVKDSGDSTRMLSIVTFNAGARVDMGWTNVTTEAGYTAAVSKINGLVENGGTFTQGGLMLGRNLYLPANAPNVDGSTGTAARSPENPAIDNRFVILLTDGNPNGVLQNTPTGANAANNYSQTNLNAITSNYPSSLSDSEANVSRARNAATTVADQIKNGGFNDNLSARLYTIGLGIGSDKYTNGDGATTKYTGDEWLKNQVATSVNMAYTASTISQLKFAFEKISETITRMSHAWIVTDPMAEYITFDPSNVINDSVNTASFEGNSLNWRIKDSIPVSSSARAGDPNTTIYTYELKYKVALDNLTGYTAGAVIPTNEKTSLTYVVDKGRADQYDESDFIEVDFTIPEILGFASDLIFIKVDNNGNPLTGAAFTLSRDGGGYGRTVSTSPEGIVTFPNIPSGHGYTLTETTTPNGFREHTTPYNITVGYGDLSYTNNGAMFDDGTGALRFKNLPITYTVTVNYIVIDEEGNATVITTVETISEDDFENGTPYGPNFRDGGPWMKDKYTYNGKDYFFSDGVNNDTEKDIFDANDAADLAGVIDGKDVVIDLYYKKIALPEIPVMKFIDKLSDASFPGVSGFTFALYILESDGTPTKVTTNLTISGEEANEIGVENAVIRYFTWSLPADMGASDLRGRTLYINEGDAQGWGSPVMGDGTYVEYGALDSLLGFAPSASFSGGIINTFSQEQHPAHIDLSKYFSGDGVELLPEFDGAALVCGETERPAVEAVYGEPQLITPEDPGHQHDETCLDEEGEQICGEIERPATEAVYGELQLITPEDPGHTHINECYAYEFAFTLEAKNGETTVYSDTVSIDIPYKDMIGFLDGTTPYDLHFDIPSECLPAPGSGGFLSVTITESSNNYGWVPGGIASGISVDPYGNVSYPNNAVNAEMINVFGGITIPGFSFFKQVIDMRSGAVDSSFTGSFTFGLYDNGVLVDTITIDINGRVASGSFDLPQYIGSTVDLTLVEVIPEDEADRTPGMAYDPGQFTISIVNGLVTTEAPVFKNILLDPIRPAATVEKFVNTDSVQETFTFEWSYTGARNDGLDNSEPVSASGTDTIEVNAGAGHFFTIDLPLNFSGTLRITEVNDGKENWQYSSDGISTKTIEYLFGVPVEGSTGAVSFTNNYYAPGVSLSKTAGTEEAILFETVNYRLEVINNGSEPLANVTVTDPMFGDATGIIRVFDPDDRSAGPLDYDLDPVENTITLTNGFILEVGARVIIRYSAVMYELGAVYNPAGVTADRTLTTGSSVESDDDHTVIVRKLDSRLAVKKYVTEYSEGMDLMGHNVTWDDDGVSLVTSGNWAAFKMVVRNDGDSTLYIDNITDVFGTTNLSGATFYYDSNWDGYLEVYVGLAALIDALSDYGLESNMEIVFYYISDALTTRGTFTNTVTVWVNDIYGDPDSDSDFAKVDVSWEDGHTPPEGNPPPPPPTPESEEQILAIEVIEEFIENAPPLAMFLPVDEFELEEVEEDDDDIDLEDLIVPQGEMPQTGVESASGALFAGLFGAMGGIGAAIAGLFKTKKKNENQSDDQ